MKTRLHAILVLLSIAACAPYSRAELEHQASLRPHNYYVVRDDAVVCSTEEGALLSACAGAAPVGRNRLIWVLGYKPVNGVWRVQLTNDQGTGFIAASAVAAEPDPAASDRFVAEFKARSPPSQWLPREALNLTTLLDATPSVRGRPVVLQLKRSMLPRERTKAGGMRFGMAIPVYRDGRGQGVMMIDLPASEVVDGLMRGDYACLAGDHCDELMLVAYATGTNVELVAAQGQVLVAPLLRVERVGDRYGEHVMTRP